MRVAFLVLLLFAGCAPDALARQTPIHRCVDGSGQPVFTDRRCIDVAATPTLPPPTVQTTTATPTTAATLCAADLGQLRQAVTDAFAAHDPNRLAGLVLWGGYGNRAVVSDIGALRGLMRQPLLDVVPAADDPSDDATDPAPAGAASTRPAPPAALVVRTGSGADVAQQARFGVIRRSGCLWLRPED